MTKSKKKKTSCNEPDSFEEVSSLYQSTAPLPEKAVKVFKWMDFQVELNLEFAGHTIDAFLKKKKYY